MKKIVENLDNKPVRIAKAIARSGLCSRRDAEKWILEGRVAVNGTTLEIPAYNISPTDKVTIDGKPMPKAENIQLWRFHKPKGLVTTHKDPEGRSTVFDALKDKLPRVISVGRLDINTEGLLLLTNHGDLARYLELPSTGWLRCYRVRAKGIVTQAQLTALEDGITLDDVNYQNITAKLERQQGANCWLSMELREGKNREIKKVLASLGLEVNRLIRTSYGPFTLSDLKPGDFTKIRNTELKHTLGAKTSQKLGLVSQTKTTSRQRNMKAYKKDKL